MSTITLWLIAGVAFMAAEAFGAPGVGLLFAGLGAIATGAALYLGIIAEDATTAQFVAFFTTTAAFAFLLWKPLKRFRLGKSGGYSNMIGDTAYVGSQGLAKGRPGEDTWSGTIMKAELAADAKEENLEAGSAVAIVEVVGAKLIVTPK